MRSAASDPAWARYYRTCSSAGLAVDDGQITMRCYRIIIEQARKRAYRDQEKR